MLATWRQAVPKHVVLGDNFCSLVFHHFTSFIMWGQTEYFHLLRFPPGTKPFVEGIFVTKKSSLHRLDLQAQEIDFLKKQLEVNPQSERHRNLVGLGCNTWKSAWKPCHQQRGIFGLRFFVEKGNRRKKGLQTHEKLYRVSHLLMAYHSGWSQGRIEVLSFEHNPTARSLVPTKRTCKRSLLYGSSAQRTLFGTSFFRSRCKRLVGWKKH